ncbi:hypothetical protein ACFFH4_16540 [Halalkalibacter alkalisediminis]|uniref:Uncharacterized protein n=1 Tax=Halalkalibacter alkalisediminis TaxID=935616 RepID=A0ABV6NJL3_9BACI
MNNFLKHLENKDANVTEVAKIHLLIGAHSRSSSW